MKRFQIVMELILAAALLAGFLWLVAFWVNLLKEEFHFGGSSTPAASESVPAAGSR